MVKIRVAVSVGCVILAQSLAASAKEPVDCVNTGIGSVSHMLVPTFRTVQRPNAMFRFNGPARQFTEDRVKTCHLFVAGHRDPGIFPFHPKTGDAKAAFRGTWDQEHATPYSYDVYFDGEGVRMRVAPGEKAGLFVFEFERSGAHALVFSTARRRPPHACRFVTKTSPLVQKSESRWRRVPPQPRNESDRNLCFRRVPADELCGPSASGEFVL